MNRSIKILLGIILGLAVIMAITLSSGGELLEGRLIYSSDRLPANVENQITPKMTNAVDVLVIVNTDDYKITKRNVNDLFKTANRIWMKPKTGIIFNVIDIKLISFSARNVNSFENYLDDYYFKSADSKANSSLPEYIVVFNKDENSSMYGGYASGYYLSWLADSLINGESVDYCSEFPNKIFADEIMIPATVIDYGHRYGTCGYDNITIISNTSANGECQNKQGTSCIIKNGYQMCSTLQNEFFAQNLLNFTANTVVHELLHSYGENGAMDHFGTYICDENTRGKLPLSSAPFDDIGQEYAEMCLNVWQQFASSKQSCS